MGAAQKLIFFPIVMLSSPGRADFLATAQRAGFFGETSAGLIFESNPRHEIELSFGFYARENAKHTQSNLAYRYSRWSIGDQMLTWKPLQTGIFAIYNWNQDQYFLESPSKYPYPDFYDQTSLRLGLELGSQLSFLKTGISISCYLRALDNSLIALYNNDFGDLKYFTASGFALQYRF